MLAKPTFGLWDHGRSNPSSIFVRTSTRTLQRAPLRPGMTTIVDIPRRGPFDTKRLASSRASHHSSRNKLVDRSADGPLQAEKKKKAAAGSYCRTVFQWRQYRRQ
jgi:hypothetical protein